MPVYPGAFHDGEAMTAEPGSAGGGRHQPVGAENWATACEQRVRRPLRTVADLKLLIDAGALTPYPELEEYLRSEGPEGPGGPAG